MGHSVVYHVAMLASTPKRIKKKRRIKLKEYHQTPEGIATQEKSRQQLIALNKGEEAFTGINADDYAIAIPTFKDISDYDLDGWEVADKW